MLGACCVPLSFDYLVLLLAGPIAADGLLTSCPLLSLRIICAFVGDCMMAGFLNGPPDIMDTVCWFCGLLHCAMCCIVLFLRLEEDI